MKFNNDWNTIRKNSTEEFAKATIVTYEKRCLKARRQLARRVHIVVSGESSIHPDYALSYVSLIRIVHVDFSLDRKIWGGGWVEEKKKHRLSLGGASRQREFIQ